MQEHDSAPVRHARSGDEGRLHRGDLEARVAELDRHVVTLAAAVDAASRMQVATPFRINHEVRVVGGRAVRRILEKGRLVRGYAEGRRRE